MYGVQSLAKLASALNTSIRLETSQFCKEFFLILHHVVLFHVAVQPVIGHNHILKRVPSVALRATRFASKHIRRYYEGRGQKS